MKTPSRARALLSLRDSWASDANATSPPAGSNSRAARAASRVSRPRASPTPCAGVAIAQHYKGVEAHPLDNRRVPAGTRFAVLPGRHGELIRADLQGFRAPSSYPRRSRRQGGGCSCAGLGSARVQGRGPRSGCGLFRPARPPFPRAVPGRWGRGPHDRNPSAGLSARAGGGRAAVSQAASRRGPHTRVSGGCIGCGHSAWPGHSRGFDRPRFHGWRQEESLLRMAAAPRAAAVRRRRSRFPHARGRPGRERRAARAAPLRAERVVPLGASPRPGSGVSGARARSRTQWLSRGVGRALECGERPGRTSRGLAAAGRSSRDGLVRGGRSTAAGTRNPRRVCGRCRPDPVARPRASRRTLASSLRGVCADFSLGGDTDCTV